MNYPAASKGVSEVRIQKINIIFNSDSPEGMPLALNSVFFYQMT